MTNALTQNQRSFVEAMKADSESAKWGFEALLERPNFALFFDALVAAGLFAPDKNPGPIATADGKYWSIPYWPALDYLEKCAKVSDENQDFELATKVLAIVKNVSRAVATAGGEPDNYHTFHKFAGITGLLPLTTVDRETIDLIPIWLSSKFDSGLVIGALDTGYLRRALASDDASSWQKACDVLSHCIAIRWFQDDEGSIETKKVASIVDDYWLGELLKHHASAFGRRAGARAADLMLQKIRQVFGPDGHGLSSSLYRPAVEDHAQNHEWRRVENAFIEGCRDVLLSWVDLDSEVAGKLVEDLIRDQVEIVRRIAIHVLNEKWQLIRQHYPPIIEPKLFDYGHLHELYNLLKNRFQSFSDSEKQQTVKAIREMQARGEDASADRSLRRMQRQWLSAIVGQGYQPADEWYARLDSDPALGGLFEHPDFSAYSETRWGSGPTPFAPTELAAFAQDGTLIDRLNSFREVASWDGPSIRSLADALTEAVTQNPDVFIDALPKFLAAKRPYQYGVINGFKRLWDGDDLPNQVNWERAWEALVVHFEALLSDERFWGAEEQLSTATLTPRRDWVVALIADFLAAGTKNDEKAFAPSLLQQTWGLILVLLERTTPIEAPGDDPMTEAINSTKGKAIEALINHALRECRLADKASEGKHEATWAKLSPPFDTELSKCRNSNFEFSTLCGAFLANLQYMSRDWVAKNVELIFPLDYELNLLCALDGLEYAPATRPIYSLLNEKGLVEHALHLTAVKGRTRERLLERVALAYLWGDETLESARFRLLFDEARIEDLQDVSDFFWSLRDQKLDEVREDRIRAFLRRAVNFAQSVSPQPVQLLSHLSRLTVFIQALGEEEAGWLGILAPHVGQDFFAYEFAEQLRRLLPQNAHVVASAFEKMLDTRMPISDYKDRIKDLLLALADHGQRPVAIRLADRIRGMRGIPEVYERLSR